jgi:anti-anti-sigma factor
MPLEIGVHSKLPGVVVVKLKGELDTETSPDLEAVVEAQLKEDPRLMLFDLQDLNYISSAGVRVLVKTRRTLLDRDGEVSLVHLQPSVRKVFDIIKLIPPNQIFASIEELDDYLDHIQRRVREQTP